MKIFYSVREREFITRFTENINMTSTENSLKQAYLLLKELYKRNPYDKNNYVNIVCDTCYPKA